MKRERKFNLDKVDILAFESNEDLDSLIDQPENQEDVLERCKIYDEIEFPISLSKMSDSNGSYWLAEHPDLPGRITHGGTKEESLANLEDAKQGWIFTRIAEGEAVPAPASEVSQELRDVSGKLLLRLPKDLHYKVMQMAKANSVSINQELVYLVSCALGEVVIEKNISHQLREIKDLLKENHTTKMNVLERDNSYIKFIADLGKEFKNQGKTANAIMYSQDESVFGQSKKNIRSFRNLELN